MLKVTVPATSANLGPGFDSLGMALDLYNHFYFLTNDDKEPADVTILPQGSLAHRAADLLASRVGKSFLPRKIAVKSHIPISRGLGSSATLTVAGLMASNIMLKANLSDENLVNLAAEIEGHPDNVAPALVGGLVISMSTSRGIKFLKTLPKKGLKAVVAVPEFQLATETARKVLPRSVPHQDAVYNTSRVGFFITAMMLGDYTNLSLAMEDLLHQPYRQSLIPGLKEVMETALLNGSLGSCLSGAGPSILAFCEKDELKISEAMKSQWREFNIKAITYILNIAKEGASWEEN